MKIILIFSATLSSRRRALLLLPDETASSGQQAITKKRIPQRPQVVIGSRMQSMPNEDVEKGADGKTIANGHSSDEGFFFIEKKAKNS